MSQVAFTDFYGPNRSGCLDLGGGAPGQPNKAMPGFWELLDRHSLSKCFKKACVVQNADLTVTLGKIYSKLEHSVDDGASINTTKIILF